MMSRLTLFVALLLATGLLATGCSTLQKTGTVRKMDLRPPSAIEVFEMRSKCAQFGESLLKDHASGPPLVEKQVSHYHLATNHCYVRLDLQTGNIAGTPRDQWVFASTFYDGQTAELLATMSNEGGRMSGTIVDKSLQKLAHDPTDQTYDEVATIMNKLMEEDRRP